MKKLIALLMSLTMVAMMAACSTGNNEATDPVVSDPVETQPTETNSDVTVENTVTFFSMSMGENFDSILTMSAMPNEDGTIFVEYVGAVKKIGNLDATVMDGIAAELAKTELATLNGAEEYGEGEANASMYIEFADGTVLTANYGGTIAEAFVTGYNAMDTYFQALTADIEVYVPQPMVMGSVDETLLTSLLAIINGSGLPNADGIAISGVAIDDEAFGYMAGLTSADGIVAAANAAPMMMSQAYSLVVVTLAENTDAEAVAKDFENNIDWRKWVCVAPTNALIAVKDNMVLCLQAADAMYTMTVDGITADGWTTVNELTNPDLG